MTRARDGSPEKQPDNSPGAIEFRDVGFRYRGDPPGRFVLNDFNLRVSAGEFFVLIGPSGCGKTTVLNLLAGFEFPIQGMVAVDGSDVRGPGVDRTVIFQGTDSLFPWLTAIENVEFGLRVAGISRHERREIAQRYLALAGLAAEGHKFPSQLSGGMKQRVQLARALACSSQVLLMDEPFGAVDAQTRATLQNELVAIWQTTRRTFFFITHDISEAITLADRIGVMAGNPAGVIGALIPVDLPRPRDQAHRAFGVMYARVRAALSEVGFQAPPSPILREAHSSQNPTTDRSPG